VTPDSFEPDSDLERELSRLFEVERRADESAAPDLDALLARRPRRRTSAGRRSAYAAAALAILATVAVLLFGVHEGGLHRVTPAAAPALQLADWESPTAFLLDTPGSELLMQVPTLAVPPTAGNAGVPQPTKGVAR
jgi:hypothetical protein